MSTYYFLGCDTCKANVPFWSRQAGGPCTIPTAREFPHTVQDFIDKHIEHGVVVFSEHDERHDEYHDTLEDYGIAE